MTVLSHSSIYIQTAGEHSMFVTMCSVITFLDCIYHS